MTKLTAEQLAAYSSGHYTDDRRDMAAEILELRAECRRLCNLIDDYDASQAQQPQPQQAEWVPWTSETRPRGAVWVRFITDPCREWLINYWSPEYFSDSSGDDFESFADALEKYEWSRDGVTWNRCGTEVAR